MIGDKPGREVRDELWRRLLMGTGREFPVHALDTRIDPSPQSGYP